MICTIRLAEDDDLVDCDSSLKIGPSFKSNGVRCPFHRKSLKMSLK